MVERLKLSVYKAESTSPVLELLVYLDPSVPIPFESIRNDMRFLFGKSSRVVFEL